MVVGGLGRGSRLGRFLPLERCASVAMMTTSSSISARTRDRVTDDILLHQFARPRLPITSLARVISLTIIVAR